MSSFPDKVFIFLTKTRLILTVSWSKNLQSIEATQIQMSSQDLLK